jgi:hypothetical protein
MKKWLEKEFLRLKEIPINMPQKNMRSMRLKKEIQVMKLVIKNYIM